MAALTHEAGKEKGGEEDANKQKALPTAEAADTSHSARGEAASLLRHCAQRPLT